MPGQTQRFSRLLAGQALMGHWPVRHRRMGVFGMGLLLLVVLLPLASRLAFAQGPEGRPFQAEAGPYHITLEQRLSHLSLGQAELVVTVLDRASRQPVTDAQVALLLQHPRSTEWARSLALGGPDAPGRYSARLNLDSPGVWPMAVEVSSSLGTVAVDAPPVLVPAMRRFTSGSWVFIGVTLTLVGGALYVWWSARRAKRNAVAAAPSPQAGS